MNKGFSLVELIVVIAIMAILVGVAVPTYTAYITKANQGVDDQIVGDITYAAKLAMVEYDVSVKLSTADKVLTVTFEGDEAEAAAAQVATIMADADVTMADNKTSFTVALKSDKAYDYEIEAIG